MTFVDRLLQRVRIRRALAHLPGAVRVVDVGAHEGELFRALGPRLVRGYGIEPLAAGETRTANYVIRPGFFPDVSPNDAGGWDAITLLAVLEHIPAPAQPAVADACARLLVDGGRVIVTVPSPAVDRILALLRALRLIDGMSLEEHYGFQPEDTARIFDPARFRLVRRTRFQLGLNNLFVFEKRRTTPPAAASRAPAGTPPSA